MTKLVDVVWMPAVGSVLEADRSRHVSHLAFNARLGVTDVYLREDEHDLVSLAAPERHLARLEFMRAAGWEVEGEAELRERLQSVTHQQGSAAPGEIDLSKTIDALLDAFPTDAILRAIADRLEGHARWAKSGPNDAAKVKALERDAESIRVTGAQLSSFGRSRIPTREPSNKRRSS
ncbi:hypothetical protein WMF45_42375 [Sorangium sp. So ce448]|uniref:hypothetical protein n=1 Tax=Sorangium sp. So ce448 TaxID=3133314 RepID=UPI003F5FF099